MSDQRVWVLAGEFNTAFHLIDPHREDHTRCGRFMNTSPMWATGSVMTWTQAESNLGRTLCGHCRKTVG